MAERRAPRLFVEVLFLAALAAALTFSDLHTYAIVGVMLVGWGLVAVFEWGVFRARPHFGSGSPPRWYMPRVSLPPPRPLEQVSSGYPAAEASSDAPTWIAPPSLLAEWPIADAEPAGEAPAEEQTYVQDGLEAEVAVAVAEQTQHRPLPEPEEPEPAEPEAPKARPKRPPRPAADRAPSARRARHRIDPLRAPAAKSRRFGRRGEEAGGDVEVPDGPPLRRFLPGQAREEE